MGGGGRKGERFVVGGRLERMSLFEEEFLFNGFAVG